MYDKELTRFSEYRIMWILVFFDLPTATKEDRRIYVDFRERLLNDGFTMFQFSIYIRHCPSRENMEVHIKRVKGIMPPRGKVGILAITDKQFGEIQLFYGAKERKPQSKVVQLEFF